MAKKISLLDIVKSKLSDKENLPIWYEERLKICETCPLNSAVKPRKEWTAQETAWVAANLGKPTCLACKCEITAKTSLPHAVCGKNTIGLEPEWNAIESVSKTESQEIENISKIPLRFTEEKGEVWVNFGRLKVGQPVFAKLIVRDLKGEMTDISAAASCGCTVPTLIKKGNDILLEIKYKNENVGEFTKTVVLSYIKNNIKFEKIFKITGNAN